MKSDKSYIHCIEIKKLLKSIEQDNEFNKVIKKVDTILMNSRYSGTSDPRRLLLNLKDKTNLKRSDKYVALSNLSICYKSKNMKKSQKNNYLKHGMKNLNYLMDHILYQIFKTILSISLKNMTQLLIISDNNDIRK